MYIRGWVATWTGSPPEMLEAWGTMRELFPGADRRDTTTMR